ncbi:hypothetical protein SAMN05216276_101042 [Streptosporangium subroseum]|uniref:Uncharacterized protein n=1 Tax=Streptosporangium subroseum TaxID=106412 RepID=A0A239EUF3_9ACTN|nr:hypothetical protein [Streptosporangium subroseum]SNS47522.1 hypothetical protein SAMN05216276_101042 [Streptosporangium subroseum]
MPGVWGGRGHARVDGVEELVQAGQLFVSQGPEDLVEDAFARRGAGCQGLGAFRGEGDELGAPVIGGRCPGFNVTGLGRELPFAGALEKVLTTLHLGDPRRGAEIIVRLARDPVFAGVTGGYFAAKNAQPLPCPQAGRDETAQRTLWNVTAELLLPIRRPHAA